MTVSYLRIASPRAMRQAAILWPAGTWARSRTVAPPSDSGCPSDSAARAISTLSAGFSRISGPLSVTLSAWVACSILAPPWLSSVQPFLMVGSLCYRFM